MALETAAELAAEIATVEAFFARPEIESGRSYALAVSSKITPAMLEAAAATLTRGHFARLLEQPGGILRVPPTGTGTVWIRKN